MEIFIITFSCVFGVDEFQEHYCSENFEKVSVMMMKNAWVPTKA